MRIDASDSLSIGDPHDGTARRADVRPDPAWRTLVLVCTNGDLAGAPIHVRELALALRARGLPVVAVFGEDGPVPATLRDAGIGCHVIPTLRSHMRVREDMASATALARVLRGLESPLLHAHSAKAGMIARLAGRLTRTPVVYTVHGWGFGPGRPRLRSAIVALIERALVAHTGHFVAVSRADARLGRERLRIPEDRLSVVHNGVPDHAGRARPERSRVVAMVARDAFPKDYPTLLRAVDGLDCELWCVGAGTDSDAFRAMVRATLGPQAAKVRCLGLRTDVGEVLAEAGLFVLSSRFEGLPLSVIEAMRAGLPVVASDVGGLRELVTPEVDGLLFEAGDAGALSASLRRLLDAPERRAAFGHAARRRYEQGFQLDATIEATLRTYRRVAARRDLRPTA